MRCLITGGAGFIGSNLADQLVKLGHNVHILDNLSLGKLSNLEQIQNKIQFKGGVFSLDGQTAAITFKEVEISDGENLAAEAAKEVLAKGGDQIMKNIKFSKQ